MTAQVMFWNYAYECPDCQQSFPLWNRRPRSWRDLFEHHGIETSDEW